MAESTVVVRVDDDLKNAFADAAKSMDRTTSQLLRDFMRDYVKTHADAKEYDSWLRQKVNEGVANARAGRVGPAEQVEVRLAKRRAGAARKVYGSGR